MESSLFLFLTMCSSLYIIQDEQLRELQKIVGHKDQLHLQEFQKGLRGKLIKFKAAEMTARCKSADFDSPTNSLGVKARTSIPLPNLLM